MKQFIIKILIYLLICFVAFNIFILNFAKYVDYFYGKFTSPKMNSFIIGDSRSFQGIQPEKLDSILIKNKFANPIYNYSFTIGQFSYDSLNFKSLIMKFKGSKKNGLFIFSVHPWVLSEPKTGIETYYKGLTHSPPHDMNNVSTNPNYEYIYKHYQNFNFKGVFRRNSILHKTGWLENGNVPKSQSEFNNNLNIQFEMYRSFSKNYTISTHKLNYLKNMISYFKKYGTVILVRMPIHNRIRNLENQYWITFDYEMSIIAKEYNITYLNYSVDSLLFSTYDGNHLDKNGGKKFSIYLANNILSID